MRSCLWLTADPSPLELWEMSLYHCNVRAVLGSLDVARSEHKAAVRSFTGQRLGVHIDGLQGVDFLSGERCGVLLGLTFHLLGRARGS